MEFWSAFQIAFDLITDFDADLIEVVGLSLRVSLVALAISGLIGLPLGADIPMCVQAVPLLRALPRRER